MYVMCKYFAEYKNNSNNNNNNLLTYTICKYMMNIKIILMITIIIYIEFI